MLDYFTITAFNFVFAGGIMLHLSIHKMMPEDPTVEILWFYLLFGTSTFLLITIYRTQAALRATEKSLRLQQTNNGKVQTEQQKKIERLEAMVEDIQLRHRTKREKDLRKVCIPGSGMLEFETGS